MIRDGWVSVCRVGARVFDDERDGECLDQIWSGTSADAHLILVCVCSRNDESILVIVLINGPFDLVSNELLAVYLSGQGAHIDTHGHSRNLAALKVDLTNGWRDGESGEVTESLLLARVVVSDGLAVCEGNWGNARKRIIVTWALESCIERATFINRSRRSVIGE